MAGAGLLLVLPVLLGAAAAGETSTAPGGWVAAVLGRLVDGLVRRYEAEERGRRVCGSETISSPDHLLFRNGLDIPQFDIEAPVCCAGYERNATTLRCQPRCSQGCPNGRCVAPDSCRCLPQFARSLAGHCVPTCPAGCLHGRCYGEECVCDPGHRPHGRICAPRCQGSCRGGNCTAPNVCTCRRAGYVVNAEGDCEPFCQGGCVNARCSAPNLCTCLEGYKKHPGQGASPNTCVPDCFDKCVNGYCAGPGRCVCHPGYALGQQRFVCVPDCRPRCVNATCTAPGVCTCQPGHYKVGGDGGGHVCAGVAGGGGACGDCANGRCSGGRCVCYDGYDRNHTSNRCVPRCPAPCGHGNCSAPNLCSCDPGYAFDFYKKECKLKCSPPCVNGACVDGNSCSCHPGFARDATDWTGRRCLPLCDPFCVNAVCSSPNQCTCKAGFAKDRHSGLDYVCVPDTGLSHSAMTTRSYGR
ncbi:epidermal growth factor-like protein [Bacillus rossius redtenbacheri]|uniref:epidermal growth factor-like protein n=1 Tax=Bacillus rossius redtenbacheri TaxID=93214 RepID=UPI002FDCEC10